MRRYEYTRLAYCNTPFSPPDYLTPPGMFVENGPIGKNKSNKLDCFGFQSFFTDEQT